MKTILFIHPLCGNGGIKSWAEKFKNGFFGNEYQLIPINISKRRSTLGHEEGLMRFFDGMLDMMAVIKDVKKELKSHHIDLMHITTSGNVGTFRDFVLVKICHKYNVPCILHCHYGCISKDFIAKGFWGRLLKKTLHLYDEIWVLDKKSETTLKSDLMLINKVFITPNSIEVPGSCDLTPKAYRKIAFVGNLIPEKGLLELVHAVADYKLEVELIIAGPGKEEVIDDIKQIAKDKFEDKIKYVGKLPNSEAIELIKSVDMIALPSYFESEAFPISIIEAMSYGKFVISTPRAAIPDMLTDMNGNQCGYLVREKSVEDIVNAIRWCQDNPKEADARCTKAFEKVTLCYKTEVVYKLYSELYNKLV